MSLVGGGRNREKYTYSIFPEEQSYCKYLPMTYLDLNFSKFICQKCENGLIKLDVFSFHVHKDTEIEKERSCSVNM